MYVSLPFLFQEGNLADNLSVVGFFIYFSKIKVYNKRVNGGHLVNPPPLRSELLEVRASPSLGRGLP